MRRRVRVGLSPASVGEAVEELRSYRSGLSGRLEELLRRLGEAGLSTAVAVVPVDTGDLVSSIRLERRGQHDYLLVADSGHAAFVEFGTGVVGQGTYAGNLPGAWSYDERRTPAAHDPADPTRWYYYDSDGSLRSTRGQAGSGYMLAASEEMRQRALSIAREVFGR